MAVALWVTSWERVARMGLLSFDDPQRFKTVIHYQDLVTYWFFYNIGLPTFVQIVKIWGNILLTIRHNSYFFYSTSTGWTNMSFTSIYKDSITLSMYTNYQSCSTFYPCGIIRKKWFSESLAIQRIVLVINPGIRSWVYERNFLETFFWL